MPVWESLILLRILALHLTERQDDNLFDKPSKVKSVVASVGMCLQGFEKQNKEKKILKRLKNPCSKFLWSINLILFRTRRGESKTRFSSFSRTSSLHTPYIR
ncbi:hypothetical protein CDAR_74491 [Caerostris darwini]|uniref:Secreted protein n=1 Tax=Caerostris darwini TaxID=1538125 RepID=A0AAV4VHM4_9ARAC|nr:hypothetical protein CDAR_74491 [Caerostris darwini]